MRHLQPPWPGLPCAYATAISHARVDVAWRLREAALLVSSAATANI